MPGFRNPAAALCTGALLVATTATTQQPGIAHLDPRLGSPDGANAAHRASNLLTWRHATAARRGDLTLWDASDRQQMATWPYGPRTDTDPGTATLAQFLGSHGTAALHPDGRRALLVRSSSADAETGIFELDLVDPRSTPRLRSPGRPTSVTWSLDGRRICWVEASGSLVVAMDGERGDLAIDVRHPVPKGIGHFSHPSPTTVCWNLFDGGAWTLDLDDPLTPPENSKDREWMGRRADGSEVTLDERHVLRVGDRTVVDHGFDAARYDFRGPPIADVSVSGDRIAWLDLVSRRLTIEAPSSSKPVDLGPARLRWARGLRDGGFLIATDAPGMRWWASSSGEQTSSPCPGGDLDQVAWSPDGRYIGVAGNTGLAVFDVRRPDRTPVMTREGRHSVSAGLAGPELCIASANGVEILHAAARRALGEGTREIGTGAPERPRRRRLELPTLLNHDVPAPFDVDNERRRPRRLRLLPLDEERIGVSYGDNRLVVFEPRPATTTTWRWPNHTDSYLEGFAIAGFRAGTRTLLVVAESMQSQEVDLPFLRLHSHADGNLLVLDAAGEPVDVVRLNAGPTAAIRDRTDGDLLVTLAGRSGDSMGLARIDPNSLELTRRFLPGSRLSGLAQTGDHEVLTWDDRSLMLLDLRTGDVKNVQLPGSEFGTPVIRAVAVSPDGARAAILCGDGVVLAETAQLRRL